jgi:hypothetical protein
MTTADGWIKAYSVRVDFPLWVVFAFAVAGVAVLVIVFVKRK